MKQGIDFVHLLANETEDQNGEKDDAEENVVNSEVVVKKLVKHHNYILVFFKVRLNASLLLFVGK